MSQHKVQHEAIVDAFDDGTPHITMSTDAEGRRIGKHYCCPTSYREHNSTGPAMFATNAYRAGHDAIDWGKKN